MPRQETERWKLSYGWLRGEDYWGDPVSDNFVATDMLLHPYAQSMTLSQPPQDLELGACWIVAAGAQGAWTGHENDLAMYTSKGWVFLTPITAVEVRLANPQTKVWWTGNAWLDISETPNQPIPPGTRYDVSVSVGYEAEPNEILLVLPIPEAMKLRTGAPDSHATCVNQPPATNVIFTIGRNGTAVGTIVFSVGNFTGTVNVAQDATFAGGDTLTITCPSQMPEGFLAYGAVIRLQLLNQGG